jgi:hypothetical protein
MLMGMLSADLLGEEIGIYGSDHEHEHEHEENP